MRNKVMNGKAPPYTGQPGGDRSLPGKCLDPAIDENYDVWASSSNQSKPIPEGVRFLLAFHNELRLRSTIHVCTDDVLSKADYKGIDVRFPEPRQQIKKVPFEATEFGGFRENEHYFLDGGHR